MLRDAIVAILWLMLALSRPTNAACECGYSVNAPSDATFAVFTDMLENDFLHTRTDNLTDFGWRVQEYDVSTKDARGPFGKRFLVGNVETNPLKNSGAWSGQSDHGGDPGLHLWVRGDHSRGFVSGAEMASVRNDSLYGTFRMSAKLSNQQGTCGAFFWFYNDSQEIDMEFLSKQFNESRGAVNLVLQTPDSMKNGYDASKTPTYKIQPLLFNPDEKYHEYRFDWTQRKVAFYVDGQFLFDMTDGIPTEGGRLFVNHWSNGDPKWSAGPPNEDTALTVSYIKAYFNSTDDARIKAYDKRCPAFDSNKVCPIPVQTVAPDPTDNNSNARTYFFSQDGEDHTPGQITYHTTSKAPTLLSFSTLSLAYLPLLMAVLC